MSFLRLFCLLLSAYAATAQGVAKLDNDPVFSTVLSRRITYPANAQQAGIYATIYAGFRVDQHGHLQNISILNPVIIGYGFEEEVIKKLKLIPPLQSKYENDYVLPVTFALVDYTNRGAIMSPPDKLSDVYFKGRILLKEINVIGSITPKRKGNELAPYSKGTVRATDR